MDVADVLVGARIRAGLTQEQLAGRAGTSRPTISAYEHGRKAPTVDTLQGLLAVLGLSLDLVPLVQWRQYQVRHGRPGWVPDKLWRLPPRAAFAPVRLPIQLEWSVGGRVFDPLDRRERSRLYEIVLREGDPADMTRLVDGALLVDAWAGLVLPRPVREAWEPAIASFLPSDATAVEVVAS